MQRLSQCNPRVSPVLVRESAVQADPRGKENRVVLCTQVTSAFMQSLSLPLPPKGPLMLRLVRAVVLLSAALFIGVRANADPLTYSFITSNTPFGIISTSLPAMPTPSSFTATSFEITAPLIVDGDPMTLPVDFFTLAAGGGA